ncbi:leucine-rich repeat domain-containing protein [Runella aurantiaca]|uniref:GTP-binding protein n=1 Tax=Runella aurantiaca TaxID=2282308 RepID=A0A369IC83_9BACT|nr:leucine-rich repeat domain-containing protein [Runella aurantiaca]RDB06480.1 GTP-binding protein [Runella aurantiaca]
MSEFALRLIAENKANYQRGKKASSLDLGNCGLNELPEELFECVWLEELILSNEYWDRKVDGWSKFRNNYEYNIITQIPPAIKNLRNLKLLRMGGDNKERWKINDWTPLESLTNLQSLELCFNRITDGSFLENLTNLNSLDLRVNEIKDIQFLKKLTKLQFLELGMNLISDISILENFPRLEFLYLRNNEISDIKFIDKLKSLKFLDLSFNQIKKISLTFFENIPLEIDLHYEKFRDKEQDLASKRPLVNLEGNTIESPPFDVLNQGREFTIAYLKNKDKRPLNECKIILIGRGSVGKTSLHKRLTKQQFNPKESETHGIRKECWDEGVKTADNKVIKINFWDFGGQHIQQALHQFFYSKNTVYILVLDKRKDENPEDFLEIVRSYGHSSPVLVVYNNYIDLNSKQNIAYDLTPELDSTLRNKYPNIRQIFGVCCGQENDEGIAQLRKYLKGFIPSLDHVRETYPSNWCPHSLGRSHF